LQKRETHRKIKDHEMADTPGSLPSHNWTPPDLSHQNPYLLYVSPMRGNIDHGKIVGKQGIDDRKMQNGSAECAHSALDTFRESQAKKVSSKWLSGRHGRTQQT
jgi:hypothetical protein